MKQRQKKHPPGTIGVSLGEIVRYAGFMISLQMTQRPQGTTSSLGQSVSIAENLNTIIRNMLPDSQWLWIQADDHLWAPDTLTKLLDLELDVVVPLILRRSPPFIPVVNKGMTRQRSYKVIPYAELPTSGVVEVHSAGTGGMLVRRPVWEKIQEMQGHDRIFEVEKGDKLAEDYFFCRKVTKAGFKIHCCLDVTMGHQGMFAIWPEVSPEGKWQLRFDMGRNRDGHMSSFYLATENQPQ